MFLQASAPAQCTLIGWAALDSRSEISLLSDGVPPTVHVKGVLSVTGHISTEYLSLELNIFHVHRDVCLFPNQPRH